MFNFLKNIMKKTKKVEGVSASEMSLKELKELAVSLKLFTVKEVDQKGKKELLLEVSRFEDKALAGKTVLASPDVADFFKGKKVVSRTPVELNGQSYEDILVEGGETFRELVK